MQLFTLPHDAHAKITTQKFLLSKSQKSLYTEVMKKLRKFQNWTKKCFLIKNAYIFKHFKPNLRNLVAYETSFLLESDENGIKYTCLLDGLHKTDPELLSKIY